MATIEALSNAAIGLLISWAATYWLFPAWGFAPSAAVAAEITLTFFALSFARSYMLRRLFCQFLNYEKGRTHDQTD